MPCSRRLVLAISALAVCPAVRALQAGDVAPLAALSAAEAKAPADLQGKLVYLDFWASWCGPCRQSFPWMNEMQRKYGARGLRIVGVNLDASRADADRFLAEVPAQFALAFDATGEAARRFGVRGMPTSVLIGADGRVIAVHRGFRKEQGAQIEEQIVAALARGAK